MTTSWHVVAKLIIVSTMSNVDYQKKVLPNIIQFFKPSFILIQVHIQIACLSFVSTVKILMFSKG